MNTRNIAALASGLAALPAGAALGATPEKPNILIIIADDLSYYNLGCYGAENNKTPNIDALADEGMRFERAYNSVSMSCPTRHCLYTGMYPYHHGGYPNHSRIKDGIKTMPVYMAELGYRVGLSGKWHVNPAVSFPFEDIPGFPKGCTSPKTDWTMDGVTKFVDRDKDQPFCLVVASINPHAPWTGGDRSVFDPKTIKLPPNFADTPEMREGYVAYMAEVGLLDKQVGQITAMLRKRKLMDNTLIFFLSEQGTQVAGAKWTNWYPGVHAGMIARWPGHIKPGSVAQAIVQYEDILPTIVTLAGGKPADMDGRDLTPVLTGKTDTHRKYAFHFHANIPEGPAYPIRAVSNGRYRLIWNLTPEAQYKEKHVENNAWFISWKASQDEHAKKMVERWYHRPEFELYDITADPFEMNNLAGGEQYAALQDVLLKELKAWMAQQNDPGASADRQQPKKPGGGKTQDEE